MPALAARPAQNSSPPNANLPARNLACAIPPATATDAALVKLIVHATLAAMKTRHATKQQIVPIQ
jgi:hypothetical protein